MLADYQQALARTSLSRRFGWVRHMQGLAIESQGPDVAVGAMCRIHPRQQAAGNGAADSSPGVLAEVVGIHPGHVTLMPYGSPQGIAAGSEVVALDSNDLGADIGVGAGLLGRVLNCFGQAIDGLPPAAGLTRRSLRARTINPLHRPGIATVLETGVRCIDGLLTLGQGQRVGIFAGSGVGKSTLLGMIARHVAVDVNVIALIGERGREVRDFIERQLGPQGLRRSVVVVATSDQPALARIRAAHAALAIAEHFREQGQQVLLTMDSITRLAMARREVGLAAGEPPTARGYTPSVFAELPQLCERCGTDGSGGAITALLAVLVEGDDLNEPISDCLRAILDGHLVLSRSLAHQGHYPAIDVLKSASRLLHELTLPAERALISETLRHLAILERNRALIEIGAYEAGGNQALDQALELQPALQRWLRQDSGAASRAEALAELRNIYRPDGSPS